MTRMTRSLVAPWTALALLVGAASHVSAQIVPESTPMATWGVNGEVRALAEHVAHPSALLGIGLRGWTPEGEQPELLTCQECCDIVARKSIRAFFRHGAARMRDQLA